MTTGVEPQPGSLWHFNGQRYTNVVLTLILFLLCIQLGRDMEAGPVEVKLVGKPWVVAELYSKSPIPVAVEEMPDVTVDEMPTVEVRQKEMVYVSISELTSHYAIYGLPVDVQNSSLRVR